MSIIIILADFPHKKYIILIEKKFGTEKYIYIEKHKWNFFFINIDG